MHPLPTLARRRGGWSPWLAGLLLALLVVRLGHGLLHQGHGEPARPPAAGQWQEGVPTAATPHAVCAWCLLPAHGPLPAPPELPAFLTAIGPTPALPVGRPYLPWLLTWGQATPRAPPAPALA